MAQQIKFFNKNKLDIDNNSVALTVTDTTATNDGTTFLNNMRNRNNASGWLTTGSNDAANTTIIFDMTDEQSITDIIIVKHNLKAFTVKYWNGSSYVDFSTPISETTNTEETNYFEFDSVSTSRIQLIITGAQVVDADKVIRQFIATEKLLTGEFIGWPLVRRARHSTAKQISKMLSGKINVVESSGAFSFELSVRNWNIDADLSIVEEIFFGRKGVLVSLSGGDDAQFSHKRVGYRKEDLYLVRATNDYTPDWVSGIYTNGIKIKLRLAEAIG